MAGVGDALSAETSLRAYAEVARRAFGLSLSSVRPYRDKPVADAWEDAWRRRYEPTSGEALAAWERPYRDAYTRQLALAEALLGRPGFAFAPKTIHKGATPASMVVTQYGSTFRWGPDGTETIAACNAQHPETGEACRWRAGHGTFVEDVPPFGRGAEVEHSWSFYPFIGRGQWLGEPGE